MATDGEVLLKTIANPKRMDILYELAFHDEGARVSDIAKALGEAPNSVSYHVRELAKAGIVEKMEGVAGDARETWYRVAQGGITIDASTNVAGLDMGALIEKLYGAIGTSSVVGRYRSAVANTPGREDDVYGFQNVLRLTAKEKDQLLSGLRRVLERAMEQDEAHKKRLDDKDEREKVLRETERVYVNTDYFPVLEPADQD